ncbi:MAG TPA: glycosyltransferase family 2 protein [Sedimentisphaerales bacterium]|nr:glycosyltransferase family 2 protein [Sedimentisphaerales bacterium]
MMDSIRAVAPKCELAVVMPVYNEEGCIGDVLSSWRSVLDKCGIDFVMLVFNDGSTDRTGEMLEAFAQDERIHVFHSANRGHGPTILDGYRRAVSLAEWIFQCDSDDEMPTDSFGSLWEIRGQADAVFGCRENRRQTLQRKIITLISRLTVSLFFGKGIRDVNTPYRLMRASVLERILEHIPADTFAPNLVVSGGLCRVHAKVASVPVPARPRRSGQVSMVRWELWKMSIQSFHQTVRCSRSMRHLGRADNTGR